MQVAANVLIAGVFVAASAMRLSAQEPLSPAPDILRPANAPAVSLDLSDDDEQLLDEIQRGCFQFLWEEVGSPVPLVMDRLTDDRVSSLAGVGFQLSAIPIGVERGWISRELGRQRAEEILQAIVPRSDNKKFGIYLHYVDLNNGGMHNAEGMQVQASTVDHALLQAGAMTVASYFGGQTAELTEQLVEEANWKVFQTEPDNYISFGWRPENMRRDVNAEGAFRPWTWYNASDEERLVYFLAVGSPNPEHAVPPEMYYKLKRTVKRHKNLEPFVVSWASPAFTYFFSHCWIDYGAFGADEPQRFEVNQPRVDWWENSRRAMVTHRQRCLESVDQFKTFAENRWGMSPAADLNAEGKMSYVVQSIKPSLEGTDNFCGGTVTPYAAGSAIMFIPEQAIAALREFRNLKDANGNYVVWRDPSDGGYGLLDSFNLDRAENQGTPDYISIDEGPMLLAIENARSGLIWKLFMEHPAAKVAVERLQFERLSSR